MIELEGYKVASPQNIETPALLVFEQQLEHNLRAGLNLAGGAGNLMPHIKTHKSTEILRRQISAGIARFKAATLTEVEMAARGGGAEVLLAYPLPSKKKISRFAALQAIYPRCRMSLLCVNMEHAAVLSSAATGLGLTLNAVMDVDIGMHRTGTAPETATELYEKIAASPGLSPAGVHAYDGHLTDPNPAVRESAAKDCLARTIALAQKLKSRGFPVPMVIMGGSTTFPIYARAEGVLVSPGTWIYWDAGYSRILAEMPFRPAALVLTQVIDRRPDRSEITLDLGTKAICTDPALADRFRLAGMSGGRLLRHNEEHAVVDPGGPAPALGDYLLAVPGHICTTVVCYPGSWFIDADGRVSGWNEHTSRDRGPLAD